MHLPTSFMRVTSTAAALAVVAALAGSSPASATPRYKAPTAKRVAATGVIVAHKGLKITLYAKTVTVGASTRSHKVVTVVLPSARAAKGKSLQTGDALTIKGTGRLSGKILTLRPGSTLTEVEAPAQAWFGVVDRVDAASGALAIDVVFQTDEQGTSGQDSARHGPPDGDGQDDDGDDGQENNDSGGPDGNTSGQDGVTGDDPSDPDTLAGARRHHREHRQRLDFPRLSLEVSQAGVTLDGADATTADLEPGQFVAAVGSAVKDTATATQVLAFTEFPDILGGTIASVTGTEITFDDETVVDLAPDGTQIPLVLNGKAAATVDQLAAGTNILLLGTVDDAGALTPQIALAFGYEDDEPAGTNEE